MEFWGGLGEVGNYSSGECSGSDYAQRSSFSCQAHDTHPLPARRSRFQSFCKVRTPKWMGGVALLSKIGYEAARLALAPPPPSAAYTPGLVGRTAGKFWWREFFGR